MIRHRIMYQLTWGVHVITVLDADWWKPESGDEDANKNELQHLYTLYIIYSGVIELLDHLNLLG